MSGKILIVDDQATNRLLLRAMLERDFYSIVEASNGEMAVECAHMHAPDLILLDVEMPMMNGYEVCKALKASPSTQHIPIIIVTAYHERKDRNLGLKAGADDFLSKPFDAAVLYARVRNLIRVKRLLEELKMRSEVITGHHEAPEQGQLPRRKLPETKLIVVAPHSQDSKNLMRTLAVTQKFAVTHAEREDDAYELISNHCYDSIIIFEELLDGGIGLRLLAKLRAEWQHRARVILFIAKSGHETGLRSLDLGANDYLIEPLHPTETLMRLSTQLRRKLYSDQLRAMVVEQLRLSYIDPLTELHNRRYFDSYMPRVIAHAQSHQRPIAVMMLDLDKFKNLNDTHGHDFGDFVLKETAERLRENLRAADMICRFGGEEFVVITPDVSFSLAETIAERLRVSIEEAPYLNDQGEEVRVTTSIGVTVVEPHEIDVDAALKLSDQALYQAKETGRNRVIFAAA